MLTFLLVLTLLCGLAPLTMAEGAKIVFQMDGEPMRMDPTMSDYTSGSFAQQNLFRGLYKFAPDGSITEGLAESVDISEDGTVYTFHLREGLKWSDGSPLTAHDFAYSWKRVLNPEFASETAYTMYNLIKGARECFLELSIPVEDLPIRALDDLTFEVELVAPTPYFLAITASSAFLPVKKEVIEEYGDAWEWDDQVFVSNGPFMLKEMRRDDRFLFVKNPHYYNADEVMIDELEYVFINAAETALLAFNNGDVDIATSLNADAERQYKDAGELVYSDRIGYRYYEIRCDREPFSDARVRKALALSLNRQVLVENVMQTYAPPLYGFISDGFPDLVDPSQSWREVHGNAFEEDVEAAQALLAEAGFPGGEGFPTFRLVSIPGTTLETVAQAMAQMWKQNLGITAEIETVESGVFYADDTGTRATGAFEVCYMGYTGDYPDPSALLYNYETDDDNKGTNWSNAEYDALMALAATGVDGQEREDLFEAAEALLCEEFPLIPIYNFVDGTLVNPRVEGFFRTYSAHPYFEYCTVTD